MTKINVKKEHVGWVLTGRGEKGVIVSMLKLFPWFAY